MKPSEAKTNRINCHQSIIEITDDGPTIRLDFVTWNEGYTVRLTPDQANQVIVLIKKAARRAAKKEV